tara:strand:- start:73 stop:699 length:627 start_codon:yes stop_codon:yes gene_type:complete
MPTRKDHSRYWRGADNRAQISKYQVVNGSIINFKYDTSHRIGVGDPSPLVFVMDTEDRQVRKTKDPKLQGIKKFHGINLNYLDVRIVQYFFIKLLSSFSWGESQLTKFPRVLLYDDAQGSKGPRPEVAFDRYISNNQVSPYIWDAWRTYHYDRVKGNVYHIRFHFTAPVLNQITQTNKIGKISKNKADIISKDFLPSPRQLKQIKKRK